MIQRTTEKHRLVPRSAVVLSAAFIIGGFTVSPLAAADTATKQPRLRAAALQFAITTKPDSQTSSQTGTRVRKVFGPLKTTIMLFDDGATRLCLITTHFGNSPSVGVCELFRRTIAHELKLPKSHVLFLNSHNHCSVPFASHGDPGSNSQDVPKVQLLPIGVKFLAALQSHARRLPALLQPVTVWWAVGQEGRITYNCKGRRADGTTYFMRERDRVLLGKDFNGDIDRQAPVVVLKNKAGQIIAALTKFTGHPVTSYHPEKPVVFGEWPQVACDVLAKHFEKQRGVPVGFLQGCAGDISSKEMFFGGVKRSTEFGHMLGQSYIDALKNLRPSRRDGLDFAVEKVNVPLASLPTRKVLIAELKEIDDFIKRAKSGDKNTLSCVGLNFPRALSPVYRVRLVEPLRAWNVWALALHDKGRIDSIPKSLEIEIAVIRIGDVGIVGMSCEPFQGIGRQIRRGSSLPISIPCGFTNV